MIIYEPKTTLWASIPKICNSNNHVKSDLTKLLASCDCYNLNDKDIQCYCSNCNNLNILNNLEKIKNISQEEYSWLVSLTNKSFWIKYFPDPCETIVIPLPIKYAKYIYEASIIGYIKGNRSHIFDDELEFVENYIDTFLPKNKNWFARLDSASPKDGKYGAGPLSTSNEIVTALATSMRVNKSLENAIKKNSNGSQIEICDVPLYLLPWRNDWNENLEFRVFVHNKKVTSISQYVWHKDVGFTEDIMKVLTPKILDFCEYVINKFPLFDFVVDIIVVLQDNIEICGIDQNTNLNVELVEFNSFGAELASGSALFHWLNDYNLLYGYTDNVYVRYINNVTN